MNRKRTTFILIYSLCTVLLLLVATSTTFAQEPTPEPDTDETDTYEYEEEEDEHDDQDEYFHELVVKLEPTLTDEGEIEELLAELGEAYNVVVTDVVPALASRNIYLLDLIEPTDDAELVEDEIDADERWDGRVVYVEPHYTGDVPESDHRFIWAFGDRATQQVNLEPNLTLLNFDPSFDPNFNDENGATEEDVIVAVIDTEIMMAHEHFMHENGDFAFVDGWDFIADEPIDLPTHPVAWIDEEEPPTDNPTDAIGHGTHVAGIVHEIAPNAKIMPLTVLDDTGEGALYVISEAILYAAENGAHIINLSLGTTFDSDLLEDAVEAAYQEHGVLVVAAAGNDASSEPHYPAAFKEESMVIAVTSVDANGYRATSANYGDWVDIAAPGQAIYSAIHHPILGECNVCYAGWSGTSMATPFVSGEAALLAQLLINSPEPEPEEEEANHAEAIRDTILEHTTPLADPPQLVGVGIADIGRAVTATLTDNIPMSITGSQMSVHTTTALLLITALFVGLASITIRHYRKSPTPSREVARMP